MNLEKQSEIFAFYTSESSNKKGNQRAYSTRAT